MQKKRNDEKIFAQNFITFTNDEVNLVKKNKFSLN